MKKKIYKDISYKKLFFFILKKKYLELFIGIVFSFFISNYLYNNIFHKNNNIKFSFKLPNLIYNKSTPEENKNNKNKSRKNQEKIYIVKQGDDLWSIAEKFYGSGFNAYDIAVANKFDPALPINEGQKLIIPSVNPRQPTKGEISSSASFIEKTKYVVQPGDSLSIIALKFYGDLYAWPKILQANNLSSPDNIEVGTELIIP